MSWQVHSNLRTCQPLLALCSDFPRIETIGNCHSDHESISVADDYPLFASKFGLHQAMSTWLCASTHEELKNPWAWLDNQPTLLGLTPTKYRTCTSVSPSMAVTTAALFSPSKDFLRATPFTTWVLQPGPQNPEPEQSIHRRA